MKSTMLTISEFIAMLRRNVNGTEIVTVDLDSDMDGTGKMRKTGNPFAGKGIVHRMSLNGVVGYIYARSVNRLADKEGKDEREVKQHPWGDMDEKHLFRINRKTGQPYLSMQIKNTTDHGFFDPMGKAIPEDEIRPFIPTKAKSSTQADLEGEVVVRDYNMLNVRAIRMRGTEYAIIPDPISVPQETTTAPVAEPVTA